MHCPALQTPPGLLELTAPVPYAPEALRPFTSCGARTPARAGAPRCWLTCLCLLLTRGLEYWPQIALSSRGGPLCGQSGARGSHGGTMERVWERPLLRPCRGIAVGQGPARSRQDAMPRASEVGASPSGLCGRVSLRSVTGRSPLSPRSRAACQGPGLTGSV